MIAVFLAHSLHTVEKDNTQIEALFSETHVQWSKGIRDLDAPSSRILST